MTTSENSIAGRTGSKRDSCLAYWRQCVLFFSIALTPFAVGCSKSKNVEREVVTEQSSSGGGTATTADDSTQTTTTRREERSEESSSSSSSCSGVLSCTVHAVGEVIAFPFRAIGYVFQALF